VRNQKSPQASLRQHDRHRRRYEDLRRLMLQGLWRTKRRDYALRLPHLAYATLAGAGPGTRRHEPLRDTEEALREARRPRRHGCGCGWTADPF
jgi:hypothetical protein